MSGADTNESHWRLFVAVWPNEDFLDSLAPVDRWLNRFNSHRIIERGQRHLTLAFIGDVAPSEIDSLREALATRLESRPAIQTRAIEVVGLPSLRSPRIVAVELAPIPELAQLLRLTLEGVAAVFPTDAVLRDLNREPRPHVTVARTRRADRARRLDFAKKPECSGDLQIREISIVRSTLTPDGPEYNTVGSVRLGGAEA